jgi:two-component system, chemotaxis family, sensor kinase CheA
MTNLSQNQSGGLMDVMDEAVQEFLVESNEGLDRFDRDLVELEKEERSPELLDGIFRVVHTIKGSGGTLGFRNLLAISHVGESVLSRMRDGKMSPSPTVTSALLAMADSLREILQQISETGHEAEGDYAAVVQRLSDLLNTEQARTSGPTPTPEPASEPEVAPNPAVGEILIASNVCRPEDVQAALQLQKAGDPRRVGEILLANGVASPDALAEALKTQAAHHDLSAGTIRVDVARLDKVMDLVGELVLARNQILRLAEAQANQALLMTTQRLDAVTTELQEAVMKTRMQPIGRLWEKLPRMVRDLSLSCGKQVEVSLEGEETDLDKTVIEAIKDPLTHIIRNAIDHGIERPEIRLARGKAAAGQLRLRAFYEGGQVNIDISDDGQGIHCDKLREKAVGKGLISADRAAAMSKDELLNLVFLPGLSTAQEVSNVSGRGVGMDVVKTNVEKIGGTVHLESESDQGTLLKIRIPLTLTIIPALVVASQGEHFAIPQANVVELVQVRRDTQAIEEIHGAPVYRLRGHLLPLVYLDRLLRLGTAESTAEALNIVVLQAGDRQFGLLVDDIKDSQEIVVKPLSPELKSIACFAGATIMGDGRVALIFDVPSVAHLAGVFAKQSSVSATENRMKPAAKAHAAASWLLFRVGKNRRSAVPLSLVSRLEEIPAATVERCGDRDVVQYRGQLMSLVRLAEVAGERRETEPETLQVIVHSHNGECIGLVVDEILDIIDQDAAQEPHFDTGAAKQVAILQQRVTDLLDIPALLRRQHLILQEAAS